MIKKLGKLALFILDYMLSYFSIKERYNPFEIKNITLKNRIFNEKIDDELVEFYLTKLYSKESDSLGRVWRSYRNTKPQSGLKLLVFAGLFNFYKYYSLKRQISKNYVYPNWHMDPISDKSLPLLRHNFVRSSMYLERMEVKTIWEFARFQELLSLALIYNKTKDDVCKQEYLDRIKDFISVNPVGYGPNWMCAMEVAIRAINLIYSLSFISRTLDKSDLELINKFISESYQFICNNLENKFEINNHYLSNIAGLLVISNYFSLDSDWWEREFIKLVNSQFNNDGSNFECSTSYHCLSLELLKIGFEELSDSGREQISEKLINACGFVDDFYVDSESKHRIGDDDSGKIIKTIFDYQRSSSSNVPLEGIKGSSFYTKIYEEYFECFPRSKYIESNYFDNKYFFSSCSLFRHEAINQDFAFSLLKFPQGVEIQETWRRCFSTSKRDIVVKHYPDFGVYFIKSEGLSIAFRVGGQMCGHRHDDNLHVDIWIDDEYKSMDPGSLNYTYLPKVRNLYRSSRAHNVPYERNFVSNDLFKYPFCDETNTSCIISDGEIKIYGNIANLKVSRWLVINKNEMKVYDSNNIRPFESKLSNSSNFYGSLASEIYINYMP